VDGTMTSVAIGNWVVSGDGDTEAVMEIKNIIKLKQHKNIVFIYNTADIVSFKSRNDINLSCNPKLLFKHVYL